MTGWIPLDGPGDAALLPLLNRPSITNSNAYLLRTPGWLVIIDPGAEPAQIDRINALVAEALAEAPRRVALLLTHAHVDHFRGAPWLDIGGERPWTALHATGDRAIREGDRRHTLADLYRELELPSLPADAVFFDAEPSPGLTRDHLSTRNGIEAPFERLPLEDGLELEVFPTPGHSPCSVTFRLGRQLFIGDLSFGASPGLVGLSGWSGEELARSSRLVRHLIQKHGIETCWTGHGDPLPAEAALRSLASLERQLTKLEAVLPKDTGRITQLRRFAVELLHEAERLFALVAARLLTTGHHLHELGEPEAAERIGQALDLDGIDAALADFRQFCRAFERGEHPELSVALKAAATMGRIQRLATGFRVEGERALTPLGRAEQLMDLFTLAVEGLDVPRATGDADILALVEELIHREQAPVFGAEEFWAATEDPDEFLRLLIGNLSAGRSMRHVTVTLGLLPGAEEWDGQAAIDAPLFRTILLSTLEALTAGLPAPEIELLAGRDQAGPLLRIRPADPSARRMSRTRIRLYDRVMREMGGACREAEGIVTLHMRAAG